MRRRARERGRDGAASGWNTSREVVKPTLPSRFSALLRSLVPCSSGPPAGAVTSFDWSATVAASFWIQLGFRARIWLGHG